MKIMSEEEFLRQLANYNDRGMKKWSGFFLSEHTQAVADLKAKEKGINVAKPSMEAYEISTVLHEAITKNKRVSVQLLETNIEGRYPDDITGLVKGYDVRGVFVGNTPIMLDSIRNIEFEEHLRWTQLDNTN